MLIKLSILTYLSTITWQILRRKLEFQHISIILPFSVQLNLCPNISISNKLFFHRLYQIKLYMKVHKGTWKWVLYDLCLRLILYAHSLIRKWGCLSGLVWLYLSTQRNFILIYIPFSEYTFFYSGLLRPWIHTLSWTISSYPPMIQCLLDDRRRHGTFVLKMASARDATLMDWLGQYSHNQPWRPAILKNIYHFLDIK